MIHSAASAPGKLFILGDYAVLEGYPALLTSVQQRASVDIQVAGEQQSIEILVNMGAGFVQHQLADTPLLNAAMTCLEAQGFGMSSLQRKGQFRLDTAAFHQGDHKLGLGSSAALSVALVAAMLEAEGYWRDLTHAQALSLCLKVHEHFQGGLGSGADVATAFAGGVVGFTRGEMPVKMTLPPGLICQFVWSGVPAGTTDYVKRLNAWRDTHKTAYNRHLQRLGQLSEAGQKACRKGDAVGLKESVQECGDALKALSLESGLMFYTDTHQYLARVAEREGCVYKPSGAGGGDFGLIVSESEKQMEALVTRLEVKGYPATLVKFPGHGVKVDRIDQGL